MTALLRYQTALLARSQRWLAPLLLYAAGADALTPLPRREGRRG